jgi:adenylyltransferase/sulfurtransferase
MMADAPPPGATPTCDTAGILGPIIGVVASLQSAEALKILSGRRGAINRRLTIIDIWGNHTRQLDLTKAHEDGDCRVCKRGEFPWLEGQRGDSSAVLCGRNAVQISPAGAAGNERVSFDDLSARLAGMGRIERNAFLLRLTVDDYVLTVFPDGRTIVSGTDDITTARTVHARYVGA